MGLISFIKGVGGKLFGNKDEEQKAAAAAPAEAEPLRASALLQKVKSLGLAYKTLTVRTNGDTVTIQGEVAKQEDAEKIALAVGNIEGVHMVDNQMTADEPQDESQYHTVESGDSLSKIAQRYYGDPMKYPMIFEANKPMLSDPEKIYPGQVLRIPKLD